MSANRAMVASPAATGLVNTERIGVMKSLVAVRIRSTSATSALPMTMIAIDSRTRAA